MKPEEDTDIWIKWQFVKQIDSFHVKCTMCDKEDDNSIIRLSLSDSVIEHINTHRIKNFAQIQEASDTFQLLTSQQN